MIWNLYLNDYKFVLFESLLCRLDPVVESDNWRYLQLLLLKSCKSESGSRAKKSPINNIHLPDLSGTVSGGFGSTGGSEYKDSSL